MIDTFAINCVGDEAALLHQLHIIKINVVSMFHLDTLLHDEMDNNISSQDEYGENEESLSPDENDSSPVLQQAFHIGNHATFRRFWKLQGIYFFVVVIPG